MGQWATTPFTHEDSWQARDPNPPQTAPCSLCLSAGRAPARGGGGGTHCCNPGSQVPTQTARGRTPPPSFTCGRPSTQRSHGAGDLGVHMPEQGLCSPGALTPPACPTCCSRPPPRRLPSVLLRALFCSPHLHNLVPGGPQGQPGVLRAPNLAYGADSKGSSQPWVGVRGGVPCWEAPLGAPLRVSQPPLPHLLNQGQEGLRRGGRGCCRAPRLSRAPAPARPPPPHHLPL